MADKHFRNATDEELLELLTTKYEVREDLVFPIGSDAPVASYVGNKEGHRYIRVYGNGVRKSMAIHRAVWIIMSGESIPKGWEIHHRDLDCRNNRYINLMCLHPNDHRKIHDRYIEEVPF